VIQNHCSSRGIVVVVVVVAVVAADVSLVQLDFSVLTVGD
jgi:hypothetical protein